MMRKQLVTLRGPGASIAPANKIRVCRQTRAENTGVKVLKRETNKGGNNSKEDHFLGHLQSTGPLRMAKVELRIRPRSTRLSLCVLLTTLISGMCVWALLGIC